MSPNPPVGTCVRPARKAPGAGPQVIRIRQNTNTDRGLSAASLAGDPCGGQSGDGRTRQDEPCGCLPACLSHTDHLLRLNAVLNGLSPCWNRDFESRAIGARLRTAPPDIFNEIHDVIDIYSPGAIDVGGSQRVRWKTSGENEVYQVDDVIHIN